MGALDFGLKDAIDILAAAFLLYQIYRLLKGTAAIRILLGMVAIYLLYSLVQLLEMRLLSEILGSFMGAGLIILVIVFQQEIRKFLLVIGSATFSRRQGIRNLLKIGATAPTDTLYVDVICQAVTTLAAEKTGVLIVIERRDPLGSFAGTGHALGAKLSRIMLESIFFKNAPLHDGATIIAQNEIIAAGAVLPLSESTDLPSKFGLRHRAAAGISERTDALALTASEENGDLHIFHDGAFEKVSIEDVKSRILGLMEA
jgi:diadenylate cyclase